MKFRSGFVSNSSSSSFVFITTKENSDLVLTKLTKEERKTMNKILTSGKFMGQDIVYYGDLTDHGGNNCMYYDLGEDDDLMDKFYTVQSKYEKMAKENKDAVFETGWDL